MRARTPEHKKPHKILRKCGSNMTPSDRYRTRLHRLSLFCDHTAFMWRSLRLCPSYCLGGKSSVEYAVAPTRWKSDLRMGPCPNHCQTMTPIQPTITMILLHAGGYVATAIRATPHVPPSTGAQIPTSSNDRVKHTRHYFPIASNPIPRLFRWIN